MDNEKTYLVRLKENGIDFPLFFWEEKSLYDYLEKYGITETTGGSTKYLSGWTEYPLEKDKTLWVFSVQDIIATIDAEYSAGNNGTLKRKPSALTHSANHEEWALARNIEAMTASECKECFGLEDNHDIGFICNTFTYKTAKKKYDAWIQEKNDEFSFDWSYFTAKHLWNVTKEKYPQKDAIYGHILVKKGNDPYIVDVHYEYFSSSECGFDLEVFSSDQDNFHLKWIGNSHEIKSSKDYKNFCRRAEKIIRKIIS